jgi:hypothetical protein
MPLSLGDKKHASVTNHSLKKIMGEIGPISSRSRRCISGEATKQDDDFYGRTVAIAARISASALKRRMI